MKVVAAAKGGTLPQVSFVKPYGNENEHPGYASEPNGSDHLVDLVKAATSGPQAKDTLVVVTYDEFVVAFDHVPVPKGDAFGPGTRIPALFISPAMTRSGVDHTQYDTTSILATIEHAFGLKALDTRDAAANDFRNVITKAHGATVTPTPTRTPAPTPGPTATTPVTPAPRPDKDSQGGLAKTGR